MSCYIKFGFGWSLLYEKNHMYLTNSLTSKMFQIEPKYQNIAKEIEKGCNIEILLKRYESTWNNFKSQLEENKAVYYSGNSEILRDSFDFGNKLSIVSEYIKQIPQISQLSIQLSNKCSLNCINCNQQTMYNCLSCHTNNQVYYNLDIHNVINAIKFLSKFGIQSLLIQGGDPLLDYDHLLMLIRCFRNRTPQGKVIIETNGISLMSLNEEKIKDIKEEQCIFLIPVIEDHYDIYFRATQKLKEENIEYFTQTRDCIKSQFAFFSNDTIPFIKTHGRPLVEQDKIQNAMNIPNNTIKSVYQSCYFGKVYISYNGGVGACINNMLADSITKELDWSKIISALDRLWRTTPDIKCNSCKLHPICISCDTLQRVYTDNKQVSTCFLNEG